MIFSSVEFLFFFLPAVMAGFFVLSALGAGHRVALAWLVAASLFFYAWWNPPFLALLVGSVLGNYAVGLVLARSPTKGVLAVGVVGNLGLLGYFKYAGFLLAPLGGDHLAAGIVLPLAISFFTFQQIAYLVDVYQGKTESSNLISYTLFVTFFPQLIAGPIVHYSETIPQFDRETTFHLDRNNLIAGFAILFIGLYKKVVIADGMEPYATHVFATATTSPPDLFTAWSGALAFTFQIYFDFSGYTDMAIGLARLFGIRLPLNFNSPYKADSIIDFWRRWHITLSRFLRDYLYVPLGGNRWGPARRHANLMVTMLLGGLWHGAAWTFVVWGGLHGAFLVVNHAWRAARRRLGDGEPVSTPLGRWTGRLLTFICVVAAWVVFRAETFPEAWAMLRGMAGLNGWAADAVAPVLVPWFAAVLALVWLAPNTQEWMGRFEPALDFTAKPDRVVEAAATAPGKVASTLLVLSLGFVGALVVAERGAEATQFIYMVF